MNAYVSQSSGNRPSPSRLPASPKSSLYGKLLTGTALVSSTLLGFALVDLFEPASVEEWIKVGLIACGAALGSIGVNRLAVRPSTALTVKGYPMAGAAALFAVGFLGASFATVTYAGLTRSDAEALRLEEHGAALARIAGENARAVTPAAQAVPIVRGIAMDLAAKAACERKESCLSGRPAGGRGPVARTAEALAERAEAIATQIEAMTRNGSEQAGLTLPLLARYQTILSEPGAARRKRPELQKIDADIRAAMAGRMTADPAAVVSAYATELERPVSIAGQAEANRTIGAILRTHSASLTRALSAPVAKETTLPVFPKPAGVADTLAYIGHFWPVAAIAIVIDLLFPLLLLLCVLLARRWDLDRDDPPRELPPHDEFGLEALSPRSLRTQRDDPDDYFPRLSPRHGRSADAADQVEWR